MAIVSPDPDAQFTIRRLSSTLWVARQADYAVGTIERGRHFVVSDGAGAVRGRFRTLAEAQAALLGDDVDPLLTITERDRRSMDPLVIAAAAAASAAIGLALSVFFVLM